MRRRERCSFALVMYEFCRWHPSTFILHMSLHSYCDSWHEYSVVLVFITLDARLCSTAEMTLCGLPSACIYSYNYNILYTMFSHVRDARVYCPLVYIFKRYCYCVCVEQQ